jgi:hypothetical protein
LEAGYDYKSIHTVLTADKQLTICYSSFCDYLAKERESFIEQQPLKAAVLPERGSGSKPGLLPKSEKYEPFRLDKTKTLADLA